MPFTIPASITSNQEKNNHFSNHLNQSVLAWFLKVMPFRGDFWTYRPISIKSDRIFSQKYYDFLWEENKPTKAKQICKQMDKMQRLKLESIKIKKEKKITMQISYLPSILGLPFPSNVNILLARSLLHL